MGSSLSSGVRRFAPRLSTANCANGNGRQCNDCLDNDDDDDDYYNDEYECPKGYARIPSQRDPKVDCKWSRSTRPNAVSLAFYVASLLWVAVLVVVVVVVTLAQFTHSSSPRQSSLQPPSSPQRLSEARSESQRTGGFAEECSNSRLSESQCLGKIQCYSNGYTWASSVRDSSFVAL